MSLVVNERIDFRRYRHAEPFAEEAGEHDPVVAVLSQIRERIGFDGDFNVFELWGIPENLGHTLKNLISVHNLTCGKNIVPLDGPVNRNLFQVPARQSEGYRDYHQVDR